ncbi:MAG TPA: HAMP domain-containing sensor histidine kinase [Flavisolibacter sp.]|nr:HAMP domain-containing sensor histidine kinase [Flavisolibacter sp.]
MKHIKLVPVLMVITILAIVGFQVYWISKSYEREERTIEMRTNMFFRETMRSLQAAKLKLDTLNVFSDSAAGLRERRAVVQQEPGQKTKIRVLPREKMVSMMDVIMQRTNDRSQSRLFVRSRAGDSVQMLNHAMSPRQNRILQFLFDVDSLQDSIKIKEVETAYGKRLDEQNLEVPFTITRVPTVDSADRRVFNEVTLGFSNPITYKLTLGDTFPTIVKRLSSAILFSVFLVGVTILSFLLLYRNLLRQRKLGDIKNEFISNITHELKTPIATVSVAIEALRSFSASMDPQKTKEYLDISANELQRLSLLVDKVLKLSMFEKKEIDLKYEPLNMRQLVDEVTSSMRLQFEKRRTVVNIQADSIGSMEGDRLHLVSVLFNLLDNALKYSADHPVIDIAIKETATQVELMIGDNGIGIPAEYHGRIFEKFFRVPHGNVHNAKGYGLGLSYVAHVVDQHKGNIKVESNEGHGSRFVITLPKRSKQVALAA